jgi:hypothetical protein
VTCARRSFVRVAWAVATACFAACTPDLGPNDGLVSSPRILAVKAEPPEARPGTAAMYTALVAEPADQDASDAVLWRFCTVPRPSTDDDAVATACLDAGALVAAGTGSPTVASTPSNACSLFGPDVPPGLVRPSDPDVTGGYYQPLRADVPGADPTFYLARILCNLASAPASIASAYAEQYVPNANPHLLPLVAGTGATRGPLATVPVGTRIALEAAWPAADAETYAYFDPGTQTLTPKREAMRVAWYASAGAFDTESTGRDESDPATTTDNGWTAPPTPGTAHLWIVLRDSRGGVDFATYDVAVR